MLLQLHIAAGALALLAGFVALFARKGSHWHRRAGQVFVWSMLPMAASGAVLAALRPPNTISVIAGLLTFHLVATSLLTVRRTVTDSRALLLGLLPVALGAGMLGLSTGWQVAVDHGGASAAIYLVFGGLALLAAGMDLRLLAQGQIQGVPRLIRHLWRMCLALLLATTSLFLGQADEFPEFMRNFALLSLPVVVVVLSSLYWLVRMFRGGRRPLRARRQGALTAGS